jgi:hypothetical protein
VILTLKTGVKESQSYKEFTRVGLQWAVPNESALLEETLTNERTGRVTETEI